MDTVGSADKASWLCFGNQSSTATSLLLPFSHRPQPSAEEGKVEKGGSESQHFGRETNKTFSWFDGCVSEVPLSSWFATGRGRSPPLGLLLL